MTRTLIWEVNVKMWVTHWNPFEGLSTLCCLEDRSHQIAWPLLLLLLSTTSAWCWFHTEEDKSCREGRWTSAGSSCCWLFWHKLDKDGQESGQTVAGHRGQPRCNRKKKKIYIWSWCLIKGRLIRFNLNQFVENHIMFSGFWHTNILADNITAVSSTLTILSLPRLPQNQSPSA